MCSLAAAFLACGAIARAGTGPGGVGDTNGASILMQWLRADDGPMSTNDAGVYAPTTGTNRMVQWRDKSGCTNHSANGNQLWNLSPANQPWYVQSVTNGKPMVKFTCWGEGSVNQYLNSYKFIDSTNWTIMFVAQRAATDGRPQYILSTGGGNNKNPTICVNWNNAAQGISAIVRDKSGNQLSAGDASAADNLPHVFTLRLQAASETTATLTSRFNGNQTVVGPSAFANDTIYSTNSLNSYVGVDSTGNFGYYNMNGWLGEMIVFSRPLCTSECTIVENSLAAKYAIAAAGVTARYAGATSANGDYDDDVIGIGREADGANTNAAGAGLLLEPSGDTMGNGEYLLAGHKTPANSLATTDLPAGISRRWNRAWYLDKTGTLDANVSFDWNAGGVAADFLPEGSYKLLFRAAAGGDFTVLDVSAVITGERVTFTVPDVQDGYYTIGVESLTDGPMIIMG